MKEIEVKILEVNRDKVVKKILALGGKKVFEDYLDAIYFDTKDNTLKNDNVTLRIRKEGEKSVITSKEKINTQSEKLAKSNIETEVEVSSFEDAEKILKTIGFEEVIRIKKTRTSYTLNNSKIEFDKYLDKYDFVPEFLEIEAQTEEEVFKTANLLGFNKEDLKPWSGKKVIKHYSKEIHNK